MIKQLRFLFARDAQVMGRVLGIVYRAIETHLIHKAGLIRATAQTGAVTLIQSFGSALNLHIHFHMLFLDGVYVLDTDAEGAVAFRRVNAPSSRRCSSGSASGWGGIWSAPGCWCATSRTAT